MPRECASSSGPPLSLLPASPRIERAHEPVRQLVTLNVRVGHPPPDAKAPSHEVAPARPAWGILKVRARPRRLFTTPAAAVPPAPLLPRAVAPLALLAAPPSARMPGLP
eukprot:7173791-Lingulodinium_polyedra.AAC.1